MKATRVLLRWYKSFNISYQSQAPDRLSRQKHPWNSLHVGDKLNNVYPFIEISLENDITTIVGGNETGKSHLLGAIAKVISGRGIDSAGFRQTDLCRYASFPDTIECSNRWPSIGVQFTSSTLDKSDIRAALESVELPDRADCSIITLIIGGANPNEAAFLYVGDEEHPKKLSPSQLENLRKTLPAIQFINANSALPDNLTFAELSAGLEDNSAPPPQRYPQAAAQAAASILEKFTISDEGGPLSEQFRKEIQKIQKELSTKRKVVSEDVALAICMLKDVLGLSSENIANILSQSIENRGFVDYHLSDWNRRIQDRLNLRKFWRQDDNAALTLRYRDSILYFDITDKTGATYTFKERSSGLRYFLSYYIQAKAMEISKRNQNAIILMDEPDSFLSILGQKNLLSVFESLVGLDSSRESCQIFYTTHSPFLINQNFPRRIRVVTKEDGEEGTQYQGRASARRYEPVRSALGIKCAQTLFMGSTNLVLEGPSDQFLLSELIRSCSTPENMSSLLDLNAIAVVSADGADNIEKLLSTSQWGDEPIPSTIVLIDSDRKDVIQRITGSTLGSKKLIEREFAVALDDLLESDNGTNIETIEDIVPWRLYCRSLSNYIKTWRPDCYEKHSGSIAKEENTEKKESTVKRAQSIISNLDQGSSVDKLGVLAEVVRIVQDSKISEFQAEVDQLKRSVRTICLKLNKKIERSRELASQKSLTQTVKRVVREFLQSREFGCSISDAIGLIDRIDREVKAFDQNADQLGTLLARMRAKLSALYDVAQVRLAGEEWKDWMQQFEFIKRSPLAPEVHTSFEE